MEKLLHSSEAIEAGRVDFPWGHMLWFCSQTIGYTDGLTMGRMVMKPGEMNDRHRHPNAEEALYLLTGRLRHDLDGKSIIQEAGDFLAIPPGSIHRSTNIGEEEADLIIAFSSGDRHFEQVAG
jgi:quercetin dioxygenase-like cupin family protein